MEIKNKNNKQKKFYAVFKYLRTGIYLSWEDCAIHSRLY